MPDSARRLASKVVAGVGLLVAGCSELRSSGESKQQSNADGLTTNRTAGSGGSRSTTPRVKPTGTKTRRSGNASGSTPTESPDPTRTSTAGSTPGQATPTQREPTPTRTAAATGGGSAAGSVGATSGAADTDAGLASSGGSTTDGSAGSADLPSSTPSDGSSGGSGGSTDGGTGDGSGGSTDGGTDDGSGGSTDGGTNDGSDDGTSDGGSDGPALSVVGESGIAPFSAERTISLGESAVGYLGDIDLNQPFTTRYTFASADGRPLNCHLIPHDQLEPMRAGEAYRTCLAFSDLQSFDMGPFTLSTGRYAIVVEQANQSSTGPVDVTFTFELRS